MFFSWHKNKKLFFSYKQFYITGSKLHFEYMKKPNLGAVFSSSEEAAGCRSKNVKQTHRR